MPAASLSENGDGFLNIGERIGGALLLLPNLCHQMERDARQIIYNHLQMDFKISQEKMAEIWKRLENPSQLISSWNAQDVMICDNFFLDILKNTQKGKRMKTLSDYDIIANIYESRASLIYRARHKQDGHPVILKQLKNDHPSAEELGRFKQEYEMTRRIHAEGVIQAYDFFTYQHTKIIVLEDFGGESLANVLHVRSLSVEEFLALAIRIADSLAAIHAQHIMHKDINPSNIVWNPQTGQLKLIDFGISTTLSHEQPEILNPNVLEGTLPYISPEQTGRMNRAIDYRTDLYSLGVTLYEMLIGQLPFQCQDALEWVHAHIAKMPTLPHKTNRNIPTPLFDIISILMAKSADERYQTAAGLKADLQNCFEQFKQTGIINVFRLRQRDISDRLQIPQKLYGREDELQILKSAFTQINKVSPLAGDTREFPNQLVLVTGTAGIGKSSLIYEMRKLVAEQQGYFIIGKFDQFARNNPYSAFISAFQEFVHQVMSESETRILQWKDKFLQAVNQNGQIIVDLIPDIEHIIGKQPPIPTLPPQEAQNRFLYTFNQFVQACADSEHSLVIVLDDLQWADGASLHLFEGLLTDVNIRYMLIIGAYRDNEINQAHAVTHTLNTLCEMNVSVQPLHLRPLSLSVINQLLAETLRHDTAVTYPFAEVCFQKTLGNPFFLSQLLFSFHENGLLGFDLMHGKWRWDIEHLRRVSNSETIIALMENKIQRLPARTQNILQLAACIGNQFDLYMLALASETSAQETLRMLWPALEEELILPLDNFYKYINVNDSAIQQTLNTHFKFLHDRIQQTAYAFIEDVRKQETHLKIGRLFLSNIPEKAQQERIFDIVDHMNIGRKLIRDQVEKITLARLNLMAGTRAKASTAYQAAFDYLQIGIELLDRDCWKLQYQLTLSLHEETAEIAYLNGDFKEMERLVEIILQRGQGILDRVKAYEIKIQAYIAGNKFHDAIYTGISALKLFGIHLPANPSKLHVFCGLMKAKFAFAGIKIENLYSLPEMKNLYKIAATRILVSIGSAAYFALPELFLLVILEGVCLFRKHGNPPSAAFAYGAYGLVLAGGVRDIESGYRFGQLALNLQKKSNTKENNAKVVFLVAGFIRHFKEHAHQLLDSLRDAYQLGLSTGNFEYAGYACVNYIHIAFSTGKELFKLEQQIESFYNTITQIKQKSSQYILQMHWQYVLNLCKQSEYPYQLIGERFDENIMMPIYLEMNFGGGIYDLCFYKMILCYLFQYYFDAIESASKAEKYLYAAIASFNSHVFYFYDSLSRLAIYSKISKKEKKFFMKRVLINQKKMKNWADHAPMNHLHKWYLVEAEHARVLGHIAQAIDYYDKAIAGARDNEYINEEALANELAAKFYLEWNKKNIAKDYMHEARYCYQRWGALAKVRHLEQTYPDLFESHISSNSRPDTYADTESTHTTMAQLLDLETFMHAAQAISHEFDKDRLLTSFIEALLKNTGAQRGVLLLSYRNHLLVEALITADTGCTKLNPQIPLERFQQVSSGIVRYVFRTRKPLIINDAALQSEFMMDEYVLHQKPKSILCAPMLFQNELTGILYLEHQAVSRVFTQERLQIVTLLCTQAAISIEHARLYKELEEQERIERGRKTAEAANQAKTEFLRTISHEIRNPLNAMILGLSNLTNQIDQPVKRDTYLRRIDASAKILQMLVNSVLDLSAIEAGQFTAEQGRFSLRETISTAIDPFMIELHDGVELNRHIASDIPAWLYGDGKRLAQILANLVSNAVKFTKKGKISVNVNISSKDESGKTDALLMGNSGERIWLHFSVQDTGTGIAEEEQQHIFEPFFQGNEAKRLKTPGTGGIGMAIVQKIIHAMGGEISLQSHSGLGTRIHLLLPFTICEQLETAESQAPSALHLQIPLRTLIVEDNQSNRTMLSDWLSGVGCEVTAVESGEAAFECWQQQPFDVILMDMHMPGIDGIQTTRMIRAHEQVNGGHIPIIALTAEATTDAREQCKEAGMDNYLPKPVNIEALLHLLKTLVPEKHNLASMQERFSESHKNTEESDDILSWEKMPEHWKNDPTKKQQYIELLKDDVSQAIFLVEDAIRTEEQIGLSKAAHKLKGAVIGKIRSKHLQECVAQLENAGKESRFDEASPLIAAIKQECERLFRDDVIRR